MQYRAKDTFMTSSYTKIAHIIICFKSNVHNFEVVLKVEVSAEFVA